MPQAAGSRTSCKVERESIDGIDGRVVLKEECVSRVRLSRMGQAKVQNFAPSIIGGRSPYVAGCGDCSD